MSHTNPPTSPTPKGNTIDEILNMPKEWVCDVKDCKVHHTTQLEALNTYIEDKVREARIEELKKVASHNNSEYTSDYIEDRLAALKTAQEEK